MRVWVVLGVVILVAILAYVRFSSANVDQVHVPIEPREPGAYGTAGGFTSIREITTTPERLLLVLDDIARNTPNTKLMAGSTAAEFLTYETRSKFFGFPDYTTVQVVQSPDDDRPLLQIYGRLRFGASDLGVNQARIQRWLDELGLLTVVP